MKLVTKSLLLLAVTSVLSSCNESDEKSTISESKNTTEISLQSSTKVQTTTDIGLTESDKANALFEAIFNQRLRRSPIFQSYLGMKDDQDKWDDLSDQYAKEGIEISKTHLAKIEKIDITKLDAKTKVSWDLIKRALTDDIEDYQWRYHNYPLNQMFGIHSQVPSLLINQHQISDLKDAEDYLKRLVAIKPLFDQVITGLNKRAELGIIAPKFVYPYVISDSENIISGMPFNEGDDSALLADFSAKLKKLEIDQVKKDELLTRANEILRNDVRTAYKNLIAAVKVIQEKADTVDGAWKFPDGETFYNNALKRTTTTDLTSDQIHELGLSEVARIHGEMKQIMKKVGFEGSLNEFFEFMRYDSRFFYEESDEGKARYLTEATALIENMKTRLDELFIVKPKAALVVKAVEAFREKSAGKAFYQSPSLDGSRPGTYYANLYRMSDMPVYQMEALAYHEGIPGHHMQRAIAQELGDIPKFRKFASYTAYTEGWGLYSELLPKEIGLYSDPYSDFGRLAMELWRACRLVVDTGIHSQKWTREQGIEFYTQNTPNPIPDAVKMVERHIVMPSQATAYKVGMLKILALRKKAKSALAEKFDIREFHDVVLKNGAIPLTVLEQYVDQYIADKS